MAQNNETTTKFKVDISELKKGIQDAQRQIRLANSEFKAAASGMKNWETSSDGLTAKLNQLKTTLTAQKSILSSLEAQYKQVCEEQGENSTAAQNLAIRINNQQAAINKTEASMNQYESELVDVSKAEADAVKNGTTVEEELEKVADSADDTSKSTKDASGGFTVLKGAMADLVASGIKAAISGLKDLASGMKQAVTDAAAYADEINTLSASTGLSTQSLQEMKYMSDLIDTSLETITGSMAKLTRNMNSAKDGTGSAADAFKELGISITNSNGELRSNQEVFGEAIDALGQMSNETQRDALAMSIFGKSAQDLNPLIKAGSERINELTQEAHDMGYVMEGEALDSLNGLNDTFDRLKLAGESLKNQFGVLAAPIIQEFAVPLVEGLKEAIGALKEGDTDSVDSILYDMFKEGFNKLTQMLPEGSVIIRKLKMGMMQALISATPQIISAATSIVVGILQTAGETVPKLINMLVSAIPTIINLLMQAAPQIIQAVFSLGTAILQALPTIIQNIIDILPELVISVIDGLMTSFDMLLAGALEFLDALVQAVPLIIKKLVKALPTIINTIVTNLVKALPQVLDAAIKLLTAIIQAIPLIIKALIPELPNIITTIVKVLVENAPLILEAAVTLLMGLIKAIPEIIKAMNGGQGISQVIDSITTGIKNGISKVKEKASDLAKGFIDALKNGLKTVTTIGEDIIKGLWNGINNMAAWIKSKIEGFGDGVLKALQDFFKIGSPSKLMRDQVGRYIAEGIAEGITENEDSVNKALADLTESASSPIDIGLNSGKARVNSRVVGSGSSGQANTNSYTFNQYNTSPKALSRLEIYRQTRNLINYSKAV